jgi:hypothetical protein
MRKVINECISKWKLLCGGVTILYSKVPTLNLIWHHQTLLPYLRFLVEYFIIIIIIIITMAKHAILHLQENEDICLDSGNVTTLLTYCNSKTKSHHSLKVQK